MKARKLLSVLLTLAMLCGIFPVAIPAIAEGEPSITLVHKSISPDDTYFEVICENTDAKDWVCIYHSSQALYKAPHSGWRACGEADENGKLVFSTKTFMEDIGGGAGRIAKTPGGWPLQAGEWRVVLYDNDDYKVILDQETLIVEDQLIKGATFVSNLYGSDANDGKTKETPVKTLKKAIELIGTANDGTVCILDGKDAEGKAEYEVYTRGSTTDSSGNWIYGGTQNVLMYTNIPAHTGTITYVGDDASSVLCFGINHFELKGPSVFRRMSLIEGYNTGKNFITNGHNVTFAENIAYIRTGIKGSTTPNAGLNYTATNAVAVDVSGRNAISSTAPARTTVENARLSAFAFGGWDSNITIANNQTLHVKDGASIAKVQLRNGKGTWKMQDINIVVDGGSVTSIADVGAGTASATALQLVFNNGISVPYTKTGITLSEGEWIMRAAENKWDAKLDVTETAGTFQVIGAVALARSSDGTAYVSEDGVLTVPAGEYNVTFYETLDANSVVVSYDGKVDPVSHTKGEVITLPEKKDSVAAKFVGWQIGDTVYSAGDTYTLPMDAFELNIISVWDAVPGIVAAYVDATNGNDGNGGKTEDDAFQSLAKAIETVDAASEEEKYVVVVGTYKLEANSFASHNNMITVTGGKLHVYNSSFPINGPTTFENIDFYIDIASKFIETHGSLLVMGEGVNITNTKASGLGMHIGTSNSDGGKETLVINSGSYFPIHVGAYYNNGATHSTQGADITVNGGTVGDIRLGADGWDSSIHHGNVFTENVNITVNGGTVTKISYNGSFPATLNKALQIILNNGTTTTVPAASDAAGGYWVVKSEAVEGSYLTATEKAGEFAVAGDLTAVANSESGIGQYVSASGILAIPEPGVYTVTYTDKVYFTNTGREVEFLLDYEISPDSLRHADIENKMFIGWTYENGEGVKTSSFKAGDKLYANYADCDLSVGGDFAIKGVQIRTKAPAGLRFIVEKSDALSDALGDIEYGTVVIPSEFMGLGKLELGATYTYNGKEYAAKTVPGTNTFADTEKGIDYTVCITKITQQNYRRMYTVRGYIKYTDLQGEEKILYTDYYATNLYTVASTALKDETITESERTYYKSIVDYVDETLKEEYMNQPKTDIKGTSADLKTWIYQLGDGVMIREVEIDSGKGGDAVEIVQLSDTHFNYCNEEDLKDPVLASTWANRRAFRYPGTQPALLNSIEYAGYADQIVVTGDAIDYLSTGCVDLLNKYLWDQYPETLIPLGNHEPVKKMQGDVAETTTVAQRYEELAKYWKHDLYYTEKILKNDEGIEKVMIIQMDNSQNKFWDSQVPLLEASVAKAKEKNIPILLFAHIPLSTRNPEDEVHYAIRINDGSGDPANFYTSFIGYNASGASKQIYDIITMNPDVFKGYFCGHWHCDYYTEIWSKNADGTDNKDVVIPQYVLTGSAYDKGHALKITVK